jgi:hypothetical protein
VAERASGSVGATKFDEGDLSICRLTKEPVKVGEFVSRRFQEKTIFEFVLWKNNL